MNRLTLCVITPPIKAIPLALSMALGISTSAFAQQVAVPVPASPPSPVAPAAAPAPVVAGSRFVDGDVLESVFSDGEPVFGAYAPAQSGFNVYYGDGSSDLQGKTEAEYLKSVMTSYQKQRDELQKKRDDLRSKSEKDNPGRDRQLEAYDRALKSYDSTIESLKKQIPEAERRAPLQKPVDVTFESATVKQAAEALSRASGVSIKVDNGVPDDTRLTVKARHVRLASILEGIARQAGLILEPDKDKDLGVIITAPASLSISVNGGGEVRETGSRPSSPWSPAWGTPPTRRIYLYGPSVNLFDLDTRINGRVKATTAAGLEASSRAMADYSRAMQGYNRALTLNADQFKGFSGSGLAKLGQLGITAGSGASLTSPSSDTVVVSEPGKNDKGEKGYFITVYKIDKDGKLNKASTTFHVAQAKKDAEDAKPAVAPVPAEPATPATPAPAPEPK